MSAISAIESEGRPRYITPLIREDLADKMAFIGGPREVGKTTLAVRFLHPPSERSPAYLNWDSPQRRSELMKGTIPGGQPIIVLDEIHKYARWRNLVKGLYDTHKSSVSFIVTGSARLDYYRKGGDSLHGRYHYYRLHPYSLGELGRGANAGDLEQLLRFGGFPEPLFKGNERFWRRWSRERIHRVTSEDVRDLENIKDVSLLELLIEILPERVGSPLSIQSLREQLEVAHESVQRWLRILETLYVCFRIAPFGSPKIRAVKKEQKLYFWDWSMAPEGGARFENLVASQLLKYCHWVEDSEGHSMELRYVRDIEKREIDFVVLRGKKPLFAVECKSGDRSPGPAAAYFRERTAIPAFYQVHLGEKDYGNAHSSVRVLPFVTFCRELGLP